MEFPDQNCYGCGKMIREKDFKLLEQRFWHKNCFKCGKCHDAIENPKMMTFIQNTIFCTAHIESGEIGTNAICPGCNEPFQPFDKNLVNANKKAFHGKCFKCCQCSKVLGDATKEQWLLHEEKFYCQPCHQKEVVFKCLKCKAPVNAKLQVQTQAGMWCPKCFSCRNCRRKLDKNAKYYEIAGAAQLFCERCDSSYQKAKYTFEMNRPGV